MLASFLHYPSTLERFRVVEMAPLRTVNYALDPIFFPPSRRPRCPTENRTPSRTRLVCCVRMKTEFFFFFAYFFFFPRKVSLLRRDPYYLFRRFSPLYSRGINKFLWRGVFWKTCSLGLGSGGFFLTPDQPVFNLPVFFISPKRYRLLLIDQLCKNQFEKPL